MPRIWFVAIIGLFGLSGCLASNLPGLGTGSSAPRDVTRTVTLYDGDVVVRGPQGYCIDRKSLRNRAGQGFVMLASCEALSGVRGDGVEPVIMTLTVLPGQADATRPSAAAVAGSLPGVQVLDTVEEDDISLVHFASGGDQALAGKDPRHWRGAMAVNGHLIGLALYGRQGSAMAGTEGKGLLRALAQNTKLSSPVRPLVVSEGIE